MIEVLLGKFYFRVWQTKFGRLLKKPARQVLVTEKRAAVTKENLLGRCGSRLQEQAGFLKDNSSTQSKNLSKHLSRKICLVESVYNERSHLFTRFKR